jgi:hypothetical protein
MQSSKEPLYIFLHIPKCAGSTIAYHLEKNIPSEERLALPSKDVKFSHLIMRKYSLKQIQLEVDKLKDKDKVKVIYGHGARYGVHKLFNRPGIYFTFVRDPVTRTISAYNYRRGRQITDLSFSDWLAKKYNSPHSKRPTSKSMVTFLKTLNYLQGSGLVDKIKIKQTLKKFFFVGITENYEEDIAYIYHLLGIKKIYPNKNISTKFHSLKKGDRTKILAKNQDDLLLYRAAVAANKKFKQTHPELRHQAKKYQAQMIWSRLIYSSCDQVMISTYVLSARLKKRFPRYASWVSHYKQSKIYTFFSN